MSSKDPRVIVATALGQRVSSLPTMGGIMRISLGDDGGLFRFEQLSALSVAFGTTDIEIEFVRGRQWSEYTSDSDDTVITIRGIKAQLEWEDRGRLWAMNDGVITCVGVIDAIGSAP